MACFI